MHKATKIVFAAVMALGSAGAAYVFIADHRPPIVRMKGGVAARQIAPKEWTFSCVRACAADLAREVCTDFKIVSEELDFGSIWHTQVKCTE